MCWFGSSTPKVNTTSAETNAKSEKDETAKAKARLTATAGKGAGEELVASKGKSLRNVFGN